jgi:hypothetical protein
VNLLLGNPLLKKIGYTNLHKMNHVGKYATGGAVRRKMQGQRPELKLVQNEEIESIIAQYGMSRQEATRLVLQRKMAEKLSNIGGMKSTWNWKFADGGEVSRKFSRSLLDPQRKQVLDKKLERHIQNLQQVDPQEFDKRRQLISKQANNAGRRRRFSLDPAKKKFYNEYRNQRFISHMAKASEEYQSGESLKFADGGEIDEPKKRRLTRRERQYQKDLEALTKDAKQKIVGRVPRRKDLPVASKEMADKQAERIQKELESAGKLKDYNERQIRAIAYGGPDVLKHVEKHHIDYYGDEGEGETKPFSISKAQSSYITSPAGQSHAQEFLQTTTGRPYNIKPGDTDEAYFRGHRQQSVEAVGALKETEADVVRRREIEKRKYEMEFPAKIQGGATPLSPEQLALKGQLAKKAKELLAQAPTPVTSAKEERRGLIQNLYGQYKAKKATNIPKVDTSSAVEETVKAASRQATAPTAVKVGLGIKRSRSTKPSQPTITERLTQANAAVQQLGVVAPQRINKQVPETHEGILGVVARARQQRVGPSKELDASPEDVRKKQRELSKPSEWMSPEYAEQRRQGEAQYQRVRDVVSRARAARAAKPQQTTNTDIPTSPPPTDPNVERRIKAKAKLQAMEVVNAPKQAAIIAKAGRGEALTPEETKFYQARSAAQGRQRKASYIRSKISRDEDDLLTDPQTKFYQEYQKHQKVQAARLLGIKPDASPTEAQQRYRQLARQYHPDVQGGSDEGIKHITSAYAAFTATPYVAPQTLGPNPEPNPHVEPRPRSTTTTTGGGGRRPPPPPPNMGSGTAPPTPPPFDQFYDPNSAAYRRGRAQARAYANTNVGPSGQPIPQGDKNYRNVGSSGTFPFHDIARGSVQEKTRLYQQLTKALQREISARSPSLSALQVEAEARRKAASIVTRNSNIELKTGNVIGSAGAVTPTSTTRRRERFNQGLLFGNRRVGAENLDSTNIEKLRNQFTSQFEQGDRRTFRRGVTPGKNNDIDVGIARGIESGRLTQVAGTRNTFERSANRRRQLAEYLTRRAEREGKRR